ncbi:hypothetical protein JHK86_019396 [Glycine max]|nr:hypothetical protein JHK86_019396 [Glycine max]
MLANPKQGAEEGFKFVLKKWQPYYFACGERNGFHCNNGQMKFATQLHQKMMMMKTQMQSASVLFRACAVTKQLIDAEDRLPTWEFVQKLWIEIMSYAGAQCRVDMHAHQLRRGPDEIIYEYAHELTDQLIYE